MRATSPRRAPATGPRCGGAQPSVGRTGPGDRVGRARRARTSGTRSISNGASVAAPRDLAQLARLDSSAAHVESGQCAAARAPRRESNPSSRSRSRSSVRSQRTLSPRRIAGVPSHKDLAQSRRPRSSRLFTVPSGSSAWWRPRPGAALDVDENAARDSAGHLGQRVPDELRARPRSSSPGGGGVVRELFRAGPSPPRARAPPVIEDVIHGQAVEPGRERVLWVAMQVRYNLKKISLTKSSTSALRTPSARHQNTSF